MNEQPTEMEFDGDGDIDIALPAALSTPRQGPRSHTRSMSPRGRGSKYLMNGSLSIHTLPESNANSLAEQEHRSSMRIYKDSGEEDMEARSPIDVSQLEGADMNETGRYTQV